MDRRSFLLGLLGAAPALPLPKALPPSVPAAVPGLFNPNISAATYEMWLGNVAVASSSFVPEGTAYLLGGALPREDRIYLSPRDYARYQELDA